MTGRVWVWNSGSYWRGYGKEASQSRVSRAGVVDLAWFGGKKEAPLSGEVSGASVKLGEVFLWKTQTLEV
jgi:hypothetical protein